MTDEVRTAPGRAPRWIKWPATLLALGAVGALLWQQLPGAGYATDLSRVGAGRPTLVLTQDNNYTGGAEVMQLMNEVRADYAAQVDFLVAHLPTPAAQAFVERHGVHDGVVLLFDAAGSRVATLSLPRHGDELRRALDQAFGAPAAAGPR